MPWPVVFFRAGHECSVMVMPFFAEDDPETGRQADCGIMPIISPSVGSGTGGRVMT
ncbi:hypothetical protein KOEU_04410 [Komagataeibacter europaeus]|uniref:Uncharacterized protein n=1 Tax=Komagataeibacter europaeus TaxID=33995 RepID=A0A0M0EKH5_KOMEU|nr:hypothetical protein KOEU_04410 [Komagataeibacter europaeus]